MHIPTEMIDRWIEEDVPGVDLTSHLLQMSSYQAQITFSTRTPTFVSGVDEAAAVLAKLGVRIEIARPEGSRLEPGEKIFSGCGDGRAIHAGWRVALNLMEYASGIAGRTAQLVEQARKGGDVLVCGTRKAFPGGRRLSQKALFAGGGVPHRMGLGETVLIFPHHYNLIGFERFLEELPALKRRAREKKIGVEADTPQQALLFAEHGADIIQLDKCSPAEVAQAVEMLREKRQDIVIGAAGGVNADNALDYALTGVDMLVTSWMYFGKPADIAAAIDPV